MPPNKNNPVINKKRYRSYSKKDSNNLQKSKKLSKQIIKGQWSQNEDEILKEWVNKNGPKHWTKCALNIPGRSGKQCREHWNNSLNNDIIKGNWTVEEDFLIMAFYNKFNGSWKKMIPIFKSRTENSIKNRFFSQIRKIASKYIKTGKRVYSTKFGLDILLKYYEEGLDEAKNKYLKNNPITEKELEEFINNIEILLNTKPKEQKFIDIEQFRKNKNNNSIINNKQILNPNEEIKELNEKLNTITKKDVKKDNILKIESQNQKKVDIELKNNTINPEESKTSIETFDIIINNNIKENEMKKIDEQKPNVEELNNYKINGDDLNKNDNKNTNFQSYEPKNDNNINYLKKNSNTVNYNFNNTYNYNINNINNNYYTNPNDANNNMNNNINNIYNINNVKNNNIISNNGFNLNAFHIDKNFGFYGKQSSDLSDFIMNKDMIGVSQGQNQNISPTYVLNLLNSNNNISDNFNNKEYSRMNSGNAPNYYMNLNSGYLNYPSGVFNNYYNNNNLEDKKNMPFAQNNERKNQFPKDQTNNFYIKRSDSIIFNNTLPNQFGYKKLPSFTFKTENENNALPNLFGYKKLPSFTSFKMENENNIFDEPNKK